MLEGIDVSEYQGVVDWLRVRRSGRVFACAKATEGTYHRDSSFTTNWGEMHQYGLIRGAYHFYRPADSPRAQVDYLHECVKQSGRFKYGDFVMLDVEVTDGYSVQSIVDGVREFVIYARQSIDKPVHIYTGAWFWIGSLGDPIDDVVASCPLWLSDYSGPPTVPANWGKQYSFWQYSYTGEVPGVRTPVDCDRFNGNYSELLKLARVIA